MPELPEVEVSRQGISPYLQGQTLIKVVARQRQLRWWIPDQVVEQKQQPILSVTRRAKYLLIELAKGDIIVHLGMSGHLKVLPASTPAIKHDHIDFVLSGDKILRLNDTRRFGAVLWQDRGQVHPLLASLGPEPLSDNFNAVYLSQALAKRRSAVKQVLMDNQVVVGVGNIYANEALFTAGILPTKAANQVTVAQIERLVKQIKLILAAAIKQGGTTLKDFSAVDGKPGYFAQKLLVYGRGGQHCFNCQSVLSDIKIGQRRTVFCPNCQQ
ncbi:bifunctional DNA-formamidopyrimidine glycosylase/DNA-(apurinic or apyrimidinic site) lyase [Rheinheimera sp. WS51]|uniref:bifunctional DNA-formamidopyrimidine glycosylase/DNA-(apurinic or apyrimidinic site) lyase n=1 Tax=Rheinheimera sp. WS51 TaxID=3425886 RepID=UPI003D8F8574